MEAFLGMDVEQASAHGDLLEVRAGRIMDLGDRLRACAGGVRWTGPDADAFRAGVEAARARMSATAGTLRSDASAIRDQAAAQDSASAAEGGGAGDGGADGGTSAFFRGLASGPYDDPGDDIAPIGAEDMTRPEDFVIPHSIDQLIDNLNIANEQQTPEATSIRVQAIVGEDGQTCYVVYVPGSYGDAGNLLNPSDTGANPNDWNQNPGALLGQDTDSRQALIAAMEAAGIPQGADVVLAGHSQGGIVASNLAADPHYNGGDQGWNITDVITVGSPVENAAVPSSTSTINFAHVGNGMLFTDGFHPGDIVPALDGNPYADPAMPSSPNRHEVTFDAPGAWDGDPFVNHGIQHYSDSIEGAQGGAADTIAAYQDSESMQNVLGDGAQVIDTVDVGVSRADGTY
ncbi:hypothetical protein [Brachybacterium hainanense]|uniref:Alpha/beta hydrolase n=1 Tax=Brachybacterium hainanense TaxID=1541174 RepID=A0ABV6RDJ9_9MICO